MDSTGGPQRDAHRSEAVLADEPRLADMREVSETAIEDGPEDGMGAVGMVGVGTAVAGTVEAGTVGPTRIVATVMASPLASATPHGLTGPVIPITIRMWILTTDTATILPHITPTLTQWLLTSVGSVTTVTGEGIMGHTALMLTTVHGTVPAEGKARSESVTPLELSGKLANQPAKSRPLRTWTLFICKTERRQPHRIHTRRYR